MSFERCDINNFVPPYPYRWRVHTRLPERFGQRLRVICRGTMNSCEVEFEDGYRAITSRWYMRKVAR